MKIKVRIKKMSLQAFIVLVSLWLGISCTRHEGAMIGDETAIFYPDNFVPEKMLPSFALLEEPQEMGALSTEWKVIPEFFMQDEKHGIRIPIDEGTDLYGTGEVIGGLKRNGKMVKLWNTDNFIYEKDNGKRLYQSHPWIMAVRKDGSAFGILIDNTWKQEIKLHNPIEIISEGPASRVIIIERETPQELLTALAELTGKIELPPLWALGFQQCRYSYYPDSRVKEITDTFRLKKIPCDVIWMDIHYMQDYKVFTFDSVYFPDPRGLNDYLHNIDFKSVWMIDPGIKKEKGYFIYDQGTEADHWVLSSEGEEYNGEVWPGVCAFPDFTRPETRQWWSGLYEDFMALGIDGVWNDMNEPAVFNVSDWTMPENNIHRGGGNLPEDIHLRYHNVYGMLMVKASQEGILNANPDKRPFVLSRSNFLGGQRYAATWTGDNASTWEHLEMATPMVLNLGLSGQPFNGPDIGGFFGNPEPELLAHWMAIGAFYPFSRNHSEVTSKNQEPWALGQKVEDISRTALDRRYRLMPYLYTLFHEASVTGLPIMRPVFFADITDTTLRNEDEAFLWGSDLLIVPRWAETPSLPKGIWRTISIVGGNLENDGFQPELKQREGSIIPLGKIIQSTEDFALDSVTLLVCPDNNMEAEGYLYQDDGEGFGYKNGEYAMNHFIAEKSSENSIVVSCERTDGNQPIGERYYKIGVITDSGTIYSGWEKTNRIEVTLPNKMVSSLGLPVEARQTKR